jgi:hypothetical protein
MDGDNFLFWVAVAVAAGLFLAVFGAWGRWMWGLTVAYVKDRHGAQQAESSRDYETMRELRSRAGTGRDKLIFTIALSILGWFALFLLVGTLFGHVTWH